MSKAQLKKLMREMSADDLADLVLQVYDARKEAKDFLEFFVNPDIRRKRELCEAAIDKEIQRVKRQRINIRITRLKEAIRQFASYGPEPDELAQLYMQTFVKLVDRGCRVTQTAAFRKGMCTFLKQTMAAIRANGMQPGQIDDIGNIIAGISTAYFDNRMLRADLTQTFTDTLATMN